MAASPSSLTGTLKLALSQSEGLIHQLEESNQTVERLRRENEGLRQELNDLRQTRKRNEAREFSVQLDQLFQKDAEKQAEIDHLKSKLRVFQARERKWRLHDPSSSSPVILSDDQAEARTTSSPSAASRKRIRSTSPEPPQPLREISGNALGDQKARNAKLKNFGEPGTEAIHLFAEDGEDENDVESVPCPETAPPAKHSSSPHQRLHALLTTTPVSNAQVLAPANSMRRPPFLAKQSADPEDAEPLRSRPVNRLNLAHFKVNSKYTGGYDYAYEEVVRGREKRKCLPGCSNLDCACGGKFRALAETLPPDPNISENDLLLEFLGPQSEEMIRTLTPLARTNLVHEARARRLANQYGKHRVAFERPSTPPGFWQTDMPSSQSDREIREQARLRERNEVEKRHQEAMRGNGRWLFADE